MSAWLYEKWQNFRRRRWFYQTRAQNIALGKQAAVHLPVKPDTERISSGSVPLDQLLFGADSIIQQHDYADTPLPPELEEIRQAYECQGSEYAERFRRRAGGIINRLDHCIDSGRANIGRMRQGLYLHLKHYAWGRQGSRGWWLIAGLMLLSMIDLVPTLAMFDAFIDSSSWSASMAPGIGSKGMHLILLAASALTFLFSIVLMGLLAATQMAAAYSDGDLPWTSIGLAATLVAILFSAAWMRHHHETATSKEKYALYLTASERANHADAATQAAKPLPQQTWQTWQQERQTRMLFDSAVFIAGSIALFGAVLSIVLWRIAGDLQMMRRRFKHLRYRRLCTALFAALKSEQAELISRCEHLRQSAQIELAQFLLGLRQALAAVPEKYPNERLRTQLVLEGIGRQFLEQLRLPESNCDDYRMHSKESGRTWIMRLEAFQIESAYYDAYYKGAIDAVHHGFENTNAVIYGLADHYAKLLNGLMPENLQENYLAGFAEGAQVPQGAAFRKADRDQLWPSAVAGRFAATLTQQRSSS